MFKGVIASRALFNSSWDPETPKIETGLADKSNRAYWNYRCVLGRIDANIFF